MRMPMGKFKGQPVEAMTTQYLAWLVTQDNIRFKYWSLVREALRILRGRFESMDDLMAEMQVSAAPQDRRPTPEQVENRKAEKAEKLRQLEARRSEEKARRRAERRAAREAEEMAMSAAFIRSRRGEPLPGQILDASHYVRLARQQQTDPNDISDLL